MHYKRTMMPYMILVMIEVTWEPSVSKVSNNANNLSRNNDVNIAEMMCKLVNEQSAPEIDIDVFGGNPLSFTILWLSLMKLSKRKLKTHMESSHVWYACSLVFSLRETHKFYSIFIWLYYVVSNPIQTLYIIFLSIICLDSICVFLITAFIFCDIVESVSYSQIIKYLLKPL